MMRKILIPFMLLTLSGSLALFLILSASLEAQYSNPSLESEPPPPPTYCPASTPEPPPKVDPVISPTNLSVQTITARFSAESMTVINEMGSFKTMCTWVCSVTILLKPDAINHLTVVGKYALVNQGGCIYGGYTLSTSSDINGNPLEIEQVGGKIYQLFFPFMNIAQ